ncbi:MAG TPA: flagellar hook-basal body complex protein FliE [Baekduia sp.]|nr:flagellar hook-basal body complex protein FliE [Baekduia sp.]
MTPIDPAFLTTGADWSISLGDEAAAAPAPTGEGSFGGVLAQQLGHLTELQVDAAEQSRALATGQADDAAAVVTAVERARLAMQLAAQLRTKGVEAINDVMHTQV